MENKNASSEIISLHCIVKLVGHDMNPADVVVGGGASAV